MLIPVHSPWLPGYINVAQTVLTILTGLFQTDLIYIQWNAIQLKTIQQYSTTWVDFENIIVREMSQSQKDKHCMIAYIGGI